MIFTDIASLAPSESELRSRLGTKPEGALADVVNRWTDEVRKTSECRYCFRKVEVQQSDCGVNLGFGVLPSRNLSIFLAKTTSAYVMAVTLGIGIDRLLRRTSVGSATDQFVLDAVSSAFVEALCDRIQQTFPGAGKARYSPGYGDLPLSCQKPLLSFLQADREAGITLTENDLMVPTKSVTAIVKVQS